MAYGQRLLPDSGVYLYDSKEGGRSWFRQTKVHQTLTLDGKDGAYRPKLLLWKPGKDLDVLVTENQSYPGLAHRRAVFFLHKRLLVLVDDAIGAATGCLELHFQMAPGGCPVGLSQTTLGQPGLIKVEEEGWVSFRYAHKQRRPAFAWRMEKRDSGNCRFVNLLMPFKEDDDPSVSVEWPKGRPGDNRLELEIDWEGKRALVGLDLKAQETWAKPL
jgi:heparan-sulfate lyase